MTEHDITNESHRALCAECTAMWADLDRISEEAKALPRLTPSRDLWAGIESRIGGVAAPRPMPSPWRRWTLHPTVRLATAASLLVAATAAVTWRLATATLGEQLPIVASTGETPIPNTATLADPSNAVLFRAAAFQGGFESLDLEIRALQLVVEKQSERLDPNTLAVLTRNLALIDKAILESRDALANDPASRFLAAQLARSYNTKLTLLRETAKLPAGT